MITGITGGIGSGKSTIARELERRGFVVYDCDKEAKRIIAENTGVQREIIGLLGEEAFADGRYNTQYVAKRVFEDAQLLAGLNAIVHPAVGLDIKKRKPDFVESAILYEAGLDILCDRIIVVNAPEEIRIARTIERDYQGDASPVNIDKVRARIKAQGEFRSQDSEIRLIVNNDGQTSIADLADEIQNWLKR
ncbi:MAG: dephospho-CoA kinase [Paludibacteraceae bacterium]|nr:dephospho-CoA kinase [Paludibacteraceae bacterium]